MRTLLVILASLALVACGGEEEVIYLVTVPTTSMTFTTTTTAPAVVATPAPQPVATTAAPTTTRAPSTTATPTTPAPTSAPTTTTAAVAVTPSGTTSYAFPISRDYRADWSDEHHDYPANDVFAACGTPLLSPVDGTITEARTVDSWDPDVNNPATRGGRSVTIIGVDGVRYYMSHLDEVWVSVGDTVSSGQTVGTVGKTGNTDVCHVHFGISPPCPGKEWAVRRGAIWPYPYLYAWQDGEQRSPVDEIVRWVQDHPDACDNAIGDANAAQS